MFVPDGACLLPRDRAHAPKCWCRRSIYRSCSSAREAGGVQPRSKPSRSRVKARLRARSYRWRSCTISSSLAASSALTELPCSAANIRISRRRAVSSLSVMFVFMLSTHLRTALFYVLAAPHWQATKFDDSMGSTGSPTAARLETRSWRCFGGFLRAVETG